MTQHHEAAENNGNADHEGTKEGLSRRQFLGLAGLGALTPTSSVVNISRESLPQLSSRCTLPHST